MVTFLYDQNLHSHQWRPRLGRPINRWVETRGSIVLRPSTLTLNRQLANAPADDRTKVQPSVHERQLLPFLSGVQVASPRHSRDSYLPFNNFLFGLLAAGMGWAGRQDPGNIRLLIHTRNTHT